MAGAVVLLSLGTGCGDRSASAARDSGSGAAEIRDDNEISVKHPEQFPLVEVETRVVADELHMNGVVAPDVNRTVPVVSLGAGRAVEVFVRLGDDVKKGQVLLRISSPDLAQAFSDYQKFQADEVLSRKQFERSRMLFDRGAIAAKDMESAQDADEKAKVDLRTSAERIRILGGDLGNPSAMLDVRSPIAGTVVEQNVVAGATVKSADNSPNLFTIANLSHVWVLCDVYEDTLVRVHVGDNAELSANALPDRVFHGRVGNISRVLDPNTRTAKVRVELENADGVFRSGMFVTALIRSRKSVPQPVVPASAVMRLHDKDWVFVPVAANKFRRTEVRLGPVLKDGAQQIMAGVRTHDKVVSNALQLANAPEAQ
ncbi:MAG TPA: efflux RND transporter periplasmic adaptor subunit [Candidatus Angelobacter sp.]|nr:efflux RND transporter periplasmic adaptor subunit [Candidatus Angelobacter sp.]